MSIDKEQLDQILRKLKNRDGEVRSKAIVQLNELKVTEAVDELTKILYEDKDFLVRSHAAAALGEMQINGQEAVKALIETVKKDPIPSVRLEAVVALGNIGSPVVVEELTNVALNDEDVRVRSWAAEALRKIKLH
ncbi:MAG: HEAT repeat domain-containing protein [Candidatus Heimdallarchaeota archaeon]